MNSKCMGIVVLLLLVIAGGVYKFIFQGSVSESADGRTAIHLTAGERDIVLAEMRAFLESVQQITEGVTENDMKRVAESARIVGKAAQQAVPGTLMGKLPIEFKQLGFDTHAKFDQLAMDVVIFPCSSVDSVAISRWLQSRRAAWRPGWHRAVLLFVPESNHRT